MKKIVFALFAILILWAAVFCVKAEGKFRDVPVIMYHHMLKSQDRIGKYVVSPDEFESDLKYLIERGYTSVTMAQLLEYSSGAAELPEKPVMITFDDGQESFLEYALPILEKYEMNAVLSVVGKYADDYTASGDRNINYSYLTWPEIEYISNLDNVEIAVHTYDMHSCKERKGCAIMEGESDENFYIAFTEDLDAIEYRLEEHVGIVNPTAFTFPFGARCRQAEDILRERGYRIFFTCEEYVTSVELGEDKTLIMGRFNRPGGKTSCDFFTGMGIY